MQEDDAHHCMVLIENDVIRNGLGFHASTNDEETHINFGVEAGRLSNCCKVGEICDNQDCNDQKYSLVDETLKSFDNQKNLHFAEATGNLDCNSSSILSQGQFIDPKITPEVSEIGQTSLCNSPLYISKISGSMTSPTVFKEYSDPMPSEFVTVGLSEDDEEDPVYSNLFFSTEHLRYSDKMIFETCSKDHKEEEVKTSNYDWICNKTKELYSAIVEKVPENDTDAFRIGNHGQLFWKYSKLQAQARKQTSESDKDLEILLGQGTEVGAHLSVMNEYNEYKYRDKSQSGIQRCQKRDNFGFAGVIHEKNVTFVDGSSKINDLLDNSIPENRLKNHIRRWITEHAQEYKSNDSVKIKLTALCIPNDDLRRYLSDADAKKVYNEAFAPLRTLKKKQLVRSFEANVIEDPYTFRQNG